MNVIGNSDDVKALEDLMELYECTVCSLQAVDPIKCSSCDDITCNKCSAQWAKRSRIGACPNCRKVPYTTVKLSRIELLTHNKLRPRSGD